MMTTIKKVVHCLNDLNCSWAIVGGCNLYLRDCLPSTNDIDIITSNNGAVLIFSRLEKYSKEKISYSEADNVRSNFFQAVIDDCTIEVMGSPENKINDRWVRNTVWVLDVEHILVQNTIVPVTTLNYEKYINQQLNNWERVKKIEDCIKISMRQNNS